MIQKVLNKLRSLGREGLFHIFGSGAFAKIGGLISSVVVIRDLPKAAYGSFVDAHNLFSYLAAFVGLGMHNAVMQYCSEKITDDKCNAIYGYSFKTGMLGNFLLTAVIVIVVMVIVVVVVSAFEDEDSSSLPQAANDTVHTQTAIRAAMSFFIDIVFSSKK